MFEINLKIVQDNTQIDLNQQCKNGGQNVKKINYACVFPLKIIPTQAYISKIQLRLNEGKTYLQHKPIKC
jgi:hypothetical protein